MRILAVLVVVPVRLLWEMLGGSARSAVRAQARQYHQARRFLRAAA